MQVRFIRYSRISQFFAHQPIVRMLAISYTFQ